METWPPSFHSSDVKPDFVSAEIQEHAADKRHRVDAYCLTYGEGLEWRLKRERVTFEGRGEKILVRDEKGERKAKKMFLKL